MSQIKYFRKDVIKILGKQKWRILILFYSRIFVGIFLYRLDRALYLMIGNNYRFLRIFLSPFFYLMQAYSNLDIHYSADIGPGLLILHSSTGIVISGKVIIGANFTLTGGNIIGLKKKCDTGDFRIGNDCFLGANACIIGPLELGNDIKIGACACVTKSFAGDNLTLAGVPANPLIHS